MHYSNILKGNFISRPNRFIANILVDGKEIVCHVKNTGRCKELLIPHAEVYVQHHDNPNRKTQYSLIAVQKGARLINMDSQAPNVVVKEWLKAGNLIDAVTTLKAEQRFGDSRFDFFAENETESSYIEVKGVTLEENGVALFPDAPTERGVKHIHELCNCIKAGFGAYLIFVVQMHGIDYFTPNIKTHLAFGQALKQAKEKGVHIVALDCMVTPQILTIQNEIPVRI